jgi:formimidoylglutamate deiminase
MGVIAPGARADFLVLDAEHPNLAGREGESLLDALVFAGNDRLVRHVAVSGTWLVRDGRHRDAAAVAERYKRVVTRLLAD